MFAVYPLCYRLGFAPLRVRDSAGGAQGRGGAHEGRHARGWGYPNPWRQWLRATPSGDERSRVTSQRDQSVERGELQKVVKWLRKGGAVGALCPFEL